MQDVNVCTFTGRLTRDAELKYTNSGTALCKFAIAVNKTYKQGDEWKESASFFDMVVWGRRAEGVHKYLLKGRQVTVQCRADQNRWQTDDGQNRSKVEFVVNELVFTGGSQQETTDGGHSDDVNDGETNAGEENQDEFVDDVPF